jgi:hypothetical protein
MWLLTFNRFYGNKSVYLIKFTTIECIGKNKVKIIASNLIINPTTTYTYKKDRETNYYLSIVA